MDFLKRLVGYKAESRTTRKASTYEPSGQEQRPTDADEQALQRYRYMLNTAPPETIEQAHEEAFAKLTPAQRAQVLRELAANAPERERATLAGSADDPKSLARLATRAEMRQPGVMEHTFGGIGRGGSGMGMAGPIFGSLVAGFVGSMVAQQFLDSMDDFGFGEEDTSELSGDEAVAAAPEDASGDYGWDDYGSGDFGDFGDFGGDF